MGSYTPVSEQLARVVIVNPFNGTAIVQVF